MRNVSHWIIRPCIFAKHRETASRNSSPLMCKIISLCHLLDSWDSCYGIQCSCYHWLYRRVVYHKPFSGFVCSTVTLCSQWSIHGHQPGSSRICHAVYPGVLPCAPAMCFADQFLCDSHRLNSYNVTPSTCV